MGLTTCALEQTRQAFDGVAHEYARSNDENPLLCRMRARVLAAVRAEMPAGGHLLDLGCGPGSDAVVLAREGFLVTATDWSPAMVAETEALAASAGVAERVHAARVGIHEIARLTPALYDGAYSNFGPLNCVPDLELAARSISARLKPGAPLVVSAIGRVCPWEVALYASRGDWSRIAMRFARQPAPVPLNGGTVWTQYFLPRAFAETFARAGFRTISLQALGLFAPPPYLDAFAHRHPRLVASLERIDRLVGWLPPFRSWGDHFLIVLRKEKP